MNRLLFFFVSFGLLSSFAQEKKDLAKPEPGQMVAVHPAKDEGRLPYWLYLPQAPEEEAKETEATKLPLVIFLHGMGERGNGNLDKVLIHGPPKLVRGGKHFPFVLIAPQCPDDGPLRVRDPEKRGTEFWWNAKTAARVKQIIAFEQKRLGNIDPDRIYVTGLSMGGFGSYQLVHSYPDLFAAAAPICGHGNRFIKQPAKMSKVPFWAFHGDKDGAVKLADQQQTVDTLKAAGVDIKFTVYKGVGHDSWTRTYNNPELYTWLLSKRRP